MRIRGGQGRWALPPDVESSTLQPLRHPQPPRQHLQPSPGPPCTKGSVSLQKDALIGSGTDTGENEDTAKGKNPVATSPYRKYDCNPISEMAADTDSSISSSSAHDAGSWLEEDKELPFKKRRLLHLDLKGKEASNYTSLERELKNSNETVRPKRKRSEKIWTDYVLQANCVAEKTCPKTKNNMNERCNRRNGRGWRCSLPAFSGHNLCEHHFTEQQKQTRKKQEKIKTTMAVKN